MSAQTPTQPPLQEASPIRHWPASLHLDFAPRSGRTQLVHCRHQGPLRVQKPFYPEADGAVHVYLLHPPGGMVTGDSLTIQGRLHDRSAVLMTTPSAGKFYDTGQAVERQIQYNDLRLENDAFLEWLPQETIIFNGARGAIHTRFDLQSSARLCAWDIVALGRAAAAERFTAGSCEQKIEVLHDGRLMFVERNRFIGGEPMLSAAWGLRDFHVTGTFLASVVLPRAEVDNLVADLSHFAPASQGHHWGLTQKEHLFIARYLGDSAARCREGFERLWQRIRPPLAGKSAVVPRIWAT